MDPNTLICEGDKEDAIFISKRDLNNLNEKSITEVVSILYEHMKDETDNLDLIARKSLVELSEKNLSIVIKCGIEVLRGLLTNNNAASLVMDQINNYVLLFEDIINKNGVYLDRTTYAISSSFVIESIQLMISSAQNVKEIEKFKIIEKKVLVLIKILIYLAKYFFNDVLNDMMQMFNPGTVPPKVIIEVLTMMASQYPVKTAQNYQEVISRTLPILASIQDENIRLTFAKFFSQVCESALIAIESRYDSSTYFNLDSISHLFATAYDLIFAQWMTNVRNSSNKNQIVNSLIIMGSILPENSIRNNLENITNIYINNLKKENTNENLLICKSFRMFLEIAVTRYKERIELCANSLLMAIFPILTGPNISPNVKDFDQNFMQVKSELLKIFFILYTNYFDKTFTFLVSKFESIGLMERLTNVYLTKTMILRGENIGYVYRDILLSTISKATHENDLELKYALFELIYILFEKNLLTQDSSVKLISYLMKEAAYSDEEIEYKDANISKNYPFYTNYKILRDKSDSVLLDIINKIQDSEKYLWPHILDYLYDHKYDGSAYIIARMIIAIKNIYDNKMEKIDFNFSNYTNLPSPQQIIIKLFIILSNPIKRHGLPSSTLSALNILVPLLHNDLQNYRVETNEIEQYLKKGKYFDFNVYNDILLSVWEKIMNEIKNSEFSSTLTDAIIENIQKYKQDKTITGFLIRMQGVVLSKLNKREVIKNQLDSLFSIAHPEFRGDVINGNIDPSIPPKEIRQGVADAYGLCSKSHMDIVLDKINAIFKSEIQYKRPSGFASFFASNKDPELSLYIISTLVTALGSIAKNSDTNLLSSRINSNFLSHIDVYFKEERFKCLRIVCTVALGNIFKSLHKLSSFYLDKGDVFILSNRDSYLEAMTKIFKNEKILSDLKIEALNNIAHLIKLDPPVSLEQCKNFIYLSFSIFDNKDFLENDVNKERSLDAVNNVFESILIHENHISTSLERTVSANADGFIIVNYENILSYDKDILSSWDFFSFILEKFVERYVTDTDTVSSKQENSEAYNQAIQIKSLILERVEIFVNCQKSVKFTKDEFSNWVASLVCLLIFFFDEKNVDPYGMFLGISRLFTGLNVFDIEYSDDKTLVIDNFVQILTTKFSKEDFLFIYKKLIYLLTNKSFEINRLSSTLLERLMKKASNHFMTVDKDNEGSISKDNLADIEEILSKIIKVLELIAAEDKSTDSERYINVLKIAEELAKINISPIVDACLKEEYGLPFPVSLTSILQSICKEKTLITKIFTKITDIINNGDPGYENKPNFTVCASTVILGTMLKTHDPVITPLIKKFFPQLLSTLLLRLGSAHSINYTVEAFKSMSEDPRNQVVWALQQLISYADEVELSTCLENGGSIQNKLMNGYEFDEGIYELMLIYCKKNDHNKQNAMFDFLSGFLDRPWGGQRVVAVSCYAQFVNFASVIYCHNSDFDVVDWRNKLVNELTKTITDSEELARKQSIRGLANLCKVYLDCTVNIESYIRITEKMDLGIEILI